MKASDFLNLVEPYPAVIFDFGGVLLNVDYDLTIEALGGLSASGDQFSLYTKKEQTEVFDLFETGRISRQEFLEELAGLLNYEGQDLTRVEDAWNAMLLDLPSQRLELIRSLREHKRLFLLSNINEIHEEVLEVRIEEGLLKEFYAQFEGIHFSHRIGKRKPTQEAFEHVLQSHQLRAEDCFFIDDSLQHVEAGRALGLRAFHLEAANSLVLGGS
ncbi:MAG: HAD family phosphatase [Bradymonadales bacterium]|nr:MAG: HAD family phosphatase [Bradymonadales bacterium]